MRILITGSTGYVGSHLVARLAAQNHEVLALVRQHRDIHLFADVQQITLTEDQEDLRRAVAKFDPEICIHLAAHLTSADDYETQQKLIEVGVRYTGRILDILKDLHLKLFINTGTFAEYYQGDTALDPAYLYAASKIAARAFVKYYASAYHFKMTTIVPYTIYGGKTNQKKVIDLIYESTHSKMSIDLTLGEQILDFIHIDDVVDFYLLIIREHESVPDNSEFFLGTGQGSTLRNLATIVEEVSGQEVNINWGAKAYRERDTHYAVANTSLQYRLWKWRPKISLVEGVKEYINRREYAA